MQKFFRFSEYKALAYRILLAYLFFGVARFVFWIYNNETVQVNTLSEYFSIWYHGLAFDTTAILYVNGLFILLSVLPFFKNTTVSFQKFLFYLYFISNIPFYAFNYIDCIYYRFNFSRLTLAAYDVVKNEKNQLAMLFRFLVTYWPVFLIFIGVVLLWIYLYKLVKVTPKNHSKPATYLAYSFVGVLVVAAMAIGGIRGDFKKSTRPINLVDANRHVVKTQQADLVLNSTFTFLRTLGVKTFKIQEFNIPQTFVDATFQPIKTYTNNAPTQPNIVLFITESFGREYCGSFNRDKNIKNYKGYTPFIDSLAQHSLIFTNAYANGYKSIHGMSSILSGIPSFKDAFTSSPYAKQDIQSLVSICKEKGYDTSFFHGAPNGSMGFLGYANILGFDHYYGLNEYNNPDDFDGAWGIWDEPFFQFMNKTISQKKKPFFATMFSASSHEPYKVPKQYENSLPKGNIDMHQVIAYTDLSFKKFFESAKKQPWFQNTLFIITADHCNHVYYQKDYLDNHLNRLAVPILIYKPDGTFKGINNSVAQHIDIFPTIIDIIGYQKPFRSWGRSLVSKTEKPFLINYNTGHYYFVKYGYICMFDGKKATGFYLESDPKCLKNLINKRNTTMNLLEKECKAFIQDYFYKIINKKLGKPLS